MSNNEEGNDSQTKLYHRIGSFDSIDLFEMANEAPFSVRSTLTLSPSSTMSDSSLNTVSYFVLSGSKPKRGRGRPRKYEPTPTGLIRDPKTKELREKRRPGRPPKQKKMDPENKQSTTYSTPDKDDLEL